MHTIDGTLTFKSCSRERLHCIFLFLVFILLIILSICNKSNLLRKDAESFSRFKFSLSRQYFKFNEVEVYTMLDCFGSRKLVNFIQKLCSELNDESHSSVDYQKQKTQHTHSFHHYFKFKIVNVSQVHPINSALK